VSTITTAQVDVTRLRRRVRAVLITGQVLAGLGMGSTLSIGALLFADLAGPALSGMAATMSTIGAALAAVPLAMLANRKGRAPALATGALVAGGGAAVGIVAAVLGFVPLLFLAIAMVGVGTAVNLQSRFAAMDLSEPGTRGRDLSLVVWATTVGAVSGPNLIAPGDAFGQSIGLPEFAGPFILTIGAQAAAAVVYLVGLRPDPLRVAAELSAAEAADPDVDVAIPVHDRAGVRTGMISIALSHATMVAVMAMTPVHLTEHGATLVIVGITISLHVAGMFALSPVFGILSDRLGRLPTIAIGQLLLLASLVTAAAGAESTTAVVVSLVLLGLGWSASTVAASALITESADPVHRTRTQGRADLLMSSVGALGGGLAGPVLALVGYSGLALVAMVLVATVAGALAIRALAQRDAARAVVRA
jgi:MFS family permease